MNVHKRCHKNVANNCGINTKMMAEILNEMGISPDKNPRPRPSKVTYNTTICFKLTGRRSTLTLVAKTFPWEDFELGGNLINTHFTNLS